jgi:hypothetical protein
MQQGNDVLAGRRTPAEAPRVEARPGLWVEHRGSGFVGVITDVDRRSISLRDDSDLLRVFPLEPRGFSLVEDGTVVTLEGGAPSDVQAAPAFTASGAVAAPAAPARVARADRILVEGIHDAELLEKIWGDELRAEGIVVEPIEGVDHLADELAARRPGPQRRFGVLLDHLVPGSKESRIAALASGPHVRVDGHEYVDVWQAVRPHVVGLDAWPVIPRGQDWKTGMCEAFGVEDPRLLWRRILGAVSGYQDLEPSLVGAVERLLDFLLEPPDEPAEA